MEEVVEVSRLGDGTGMNGVCCIAGGVRGLALLGATGSQCGKADSGRALARGVSTGDGGVSASQGSSIGGFLL